MYNREYIQNRQFSMTDITIGTIIKTDILNTWPNWLGIGRELV